MSLKDGLYSASVALRQLSAEWAKDGKEDIARGDIVSSMSKIPFMITILKTLETIDRELAIVIASEIKTAPTPKDGSGEH